MIYHMDSFTKTNNLNALIVQVMELMVEPLVKETVRSYVVIVWLEMLLLAFSLVG
jgi:hypothetical protein